MLVPIGLGVLGRTCRCGMSSAVGIAWYVVWNHCSRSPVLLASEGFSSTVLPVLVGVPLGVVIGISCGLVFSLGTRLLRVVGSSFDRVLYRFSKMHCDSVWFDF